MSILDSPWDGTVYSPPTALDIATIQAAIVAQLQATVGAAGPNTIEVMAFPDKPESYEMRHRIGAALVIYTGSDYGPLLDAGQVVQERTMEFAIGVRIRDLGWAFGGAASGPSPGAYQVLEGIRAALTGFQPNTGCTKLYPHAEKFIDRDKQGGVWIYEIRFRTRTMAVEGYAPPSFPPFTLGTAQEEGGVTNVLVATAEYTFSGSPGTITLGHGNISGVVVGRSPGGPPYLFGADYTLDTVNGIITRVAGGAIAAGATVAVSYSYAEVVTAVAGGGNAPFSPHN